MLRIGFPEVSVRAPDAEGVSLDRLDLFTREQKQHSLPAAPDFGIELRSPSDSPRELQEKMNIWMRNGVQLAWRVDPLDRTATIYRPNQAQEGREHLSQVAGERPVAGFMLPLDRTFA